MKVRLIYIVLAVLTLLSCEKQIEGVRPASPSGYIMFLPGVETKASLATSMKECFPFGVFGFNYSKETNWNTARSTTAPQVFYNKSVEYVDGVFKYDGLKSWDDVQKCSFFAYYPMVSDLNNNISISSSTSLDVPIVTYNFPFPASSATVLEVPSSAKILDLMTASAIDITSVGTGYVNLNFEHRLFCIEVVVRNYNTSPVNIRNLDLTLQGLKHTSISIPMHKGDAKKSIVYNGTAPSSTKFRITESGRDVVVPGYTNSENISYSISEKGSESGGYLMLIPQSASTVTATVSWEGIEDYTSVNNSFTTDFAYEEGKKYVVVINVAGEAISITIIQEESWNSKDVNIEFN